MEPKELAVQALLAFNDDGAKGFLDFLKAHEAFDPDFVMAIQSDAPNGGEWHGAEGFEEMVRSWLEAWDVFELQPEEAIELAPGRLLIPTRQRAVARGIGLELNERFFYTVNLEDGRFRRLGLFTDRSLAEAALGVGPGEG